MPKVVISDTSTLILFHRIDEIDLLCKVYGELITTPEVAEEFGEDLPIWIKVQEVTDKKYQSFLETLVDYGEASAIALATEYDDVLLILDDLKARKLALRLKLKITGTLGIIHKAKEMSIIQNVKPLIDKLMLTDFRISKKIIEEILSINNEKLQSDEQNKRRPEISTITFTGNQGRKQQVIEFCDPKHRLKIFYL